MEYTVDYFLNKFSSIPEELWTWGNFELNGQSCAAGHCGIRDANKLNAEANSLIELFSKLKLSPVFGVSFYGNKLYDTVAVINDGHCAEYNQETPKKRILAALNDVKKMQEPKPKEIIRYVAVPETIKEQEKELVLN